MTKTEAMNQNTDIVEGSGAEFSDDRKYRYALWRIWDAKKPLVMFIGLNPSTANESDNDPTIKSVCRIAKNNGYGGVYMMNCFTYVTAYPSELAKVTLKETVENYENLKRIKEQVSDTVFAWGSFDIPNQITTAMCELFPNAKALHINKNGSPKHPLYCKSDSQLIPYNSTQTNINK